MTLVLDASAALALVVARPERLSIAAILKHHRLLRIKWKDLQDRYRLAIALADELIPAANLHLEALRLACQLGFPADDAFYLAAARRRKAAILTLDRRLIGAAERLGIPIAGSWLRL